MPDCSPVCVSSHWGSVARVGGWSAALQPFFFFANVTDDDLKELSGAAKHKFVYLLTKATFFIAGGWWRGWVDKPRALWLFHFPTVLYRNVTQMTEGIGCTRDASLKHTLPRPTPPTQAQSSPSPDEHVKNPHQQLTSDAQIFKITRFLLPGSKRPTSAVKS